MASEHESSIAWRDTIRIQKGGAEREDLQPCIPPGIVTTKYENIVDEYYKADEDAGRMVEGPRSRGVQQVPIALTVRGPASLRRGGLLDRDGTAGPDIPQQEWSTEPYKVVIGKRNVS